MRATLLILVLLLSACGGGGSDGAAGSDDPTDSAAADPADGATAAPTQAATTNPKDDAGADLGGVGDTGEGDGQADGPPPTEPPADGPPPTAAPPPEPAGPPTEDLPGGRYVQIDAITAEGNSYAVSFTPLNFTPLIGTGPQDYHIHFFWNTLEPQNAGTNGPNPGEWFLYDGASPFNGWTFGDRPPEATQMCALVADAAHGVTVGSGNCVTLP